MRNSIFRFVSQKYCINHYSHSYDKISDKNVKEELLILLMFYKMLLLHKRREKRSREDTSCHWGSRKNSLYLGPFFNHSVILAPDHGMAPTHSRETISLVVLFGNSLTVNQELCFTSLLGVPQPSPHDNQDQSGHGYGHVCFIWNIYSYDLWSENHYQVTVSTLYWKIICVIYGIPSLIILMWCNLTK